MFAVGGERCFDIIPPAVYRAKQWNFCMFVRNKSFGQGSATTKWLTINTKFSERRTQIKEKNKVFWPNCITVQETEELWV